MNVIAMLARAELDALNILHAQRVPPCLTEAQQREADTKRYDEAKHRLGIHDAHVLAYHDNEDFIPF